MKWVGSDMGLLDFFSRDSKQQPQEMDGNSTYATKRIDK
jgi:hypothetical protein